MTPVAVPPALLRIDEVADRLAISRATIYRLIRRGAIPTVHIGSSVRIPAAELDRWLRAQVATSSTDPTR